MRESSWDCWRSEEVRYKKNQLRKRIIWISIATFIIILAGPVIIIRIFYPQKYVLDLGFSISDVIQVGIIIIAIAGPLIVNLLIKRLEQPIIEVDFEQKEPFVFEAKKRFFKFKLKDELLPEERHIHYCLKIKNTGLSKLSDCEGVLTRILKLNESDEDQKVEEIIPFNLKWIDYVREQKIEINPEREYLLAIATVNKTFNLQNNTRIENGAFFRLYAAHDVVGEMKKLPEGKYEMYINIYSNNADMVEVMVNLDFKITEAKQAGIVEPDIKMKIERVN
jgi:hypothetical protein